MSELIYAVDEPDGTTGYMLWRYGHVVAWCAWPQPLEAAYPDAIRAGTLGSDELRYFLPSGPPSPAHNRRDLYDDLVARMREGLV